jgi:hypothetical protein
MARKQPNDQLILYQLDGKKWFNKDLKVYLSLSVFANVRIFSLFDYILSFSGRQCCDQL